MSDGEGKPGRVTRHTNHSTLDAMYGSEDRQEADVNNHLGFVNTRNFLKNTSGLYYE